MDAARRTDALDDVWRFAVSGPSKGTRSRLLFAAETAVRDGGVERDPRVETAALAVEMFHLASLPHDDLMDGSGLRRGVQSLPARFGAPLAAAGGGLFFGRALSLISACGPEAVAIAVGTAESMSAGQMLELRDRYDTGRTPARCLEAIRGKTAGMFWLAAALGALLGGGNAAMRRALGKYGLALGVGFQVIDDVLDIAADGRITGKPRGNDLQNGNYTLVAIYALEEVPELVDLLGHDSDGEDAERRILETGAIARASAEARRWIDDAKDAVRAMPGAGDLLAIADAELARLEGIAS